MRKVIAFSGTHGTGKSSVAYDLAAKLKVAGKNVVVCDELARECPLPINQEAGELTQHWIIASQMRREIKLMSRYGIVVSDRSVIDALAYGTILKVMDDSWGHVLRKYINTYYIGVYLLDPEVFNYHVPDGVRDMDTSFRMAVHNQLITLYETFNISYTYISSREYLNEVYNKLNI